LLILVSLLHRIWLASQLRDIWGLVRDPKSYQFTSKQDPKILQTQILGKNVELDYLFVQNKLIGSSYKLEDNYLNPEHFIVTYQKFKDALTQKYGPAQKDEIVWLNDVYRNQRRKRGLALSLGHVEYHTSWETPDTMISCRLKERNYYVECLVEYWSKELSVLQQKLKNEEKIDPF